MKDWEKGLAPFKAVQKEDRIYGRGTSDNTYAVFSSILAIKACQVNGLRHPRMVMLFQGDAESGGSDLYHYMDKLSLKNVALVVCLDGGCGNYDQWWTTTSQRGVIGCCVKVRVLEDGVHSGMASGIVPSPFRIMRSLIERIEYSKDGNVLEDF
jgi:acetylornithine deacetylase/succinyl-diaminopimelate desuccinylase-like protein